MILRNEIVDDECILRDLKDDLTHANADMEKVMYEKMTPVHMQTSVIGSLPNVILKCLKSFNMSNFCAEILNYIIILLQRQ